jgi:hypothetical protein
LLRLGCVALLGAAAWGCARDSARIQLHVVVPDGVLQKPPWLTVTFGTHDPVTIDPETVAWHKTPPPMTIDLQFEVPGLGPDGTTAVVISAYKTQGDSPVLTATKDVKAGTTSTIDLMKPTMSGNGGTSGAGGTGGTGGAGGTGATGGSAPAGTGGAGGGMAGAGGDAQQDGGAAGADGAGNPCDDAGGQEAGGPEVGAPGQTCEKYCNLMAMNCGMDLSTCQKTCTGLRWEPITDMNSVGNNLTCRILNAGFGRDIPKDCQKATWNGLETTGCGTPCDVYCDAGKVICSGAATFTDNACADTCYASLTPANRDCRVQALIDGDCSKAASGTGCL